MSASRKWCPLNRSTFLDPVVPKDNLSCISTTENQIRMESRKGSRQHRWLTVKNKLWSCLLEFSVPHKTYTIGIIWRVFIAAVRSHEQFRELRRPVHRSDTTVSRPTVAEKWTVQPQTLMAFFVPIILFKINFNFIFIKTILKNFLQ